ncbi:MAG: hypothetical protein ACSHX4_12490 [Opitutaceae bacterium]
MYLPTQNIPKPRRSAQGFALVIALGLMAFVLLLLLSMSTLVQVESQGSDIALKQVEAEQAALLGLNVALGKLQETLGVDQRVTANASILGDSNNPYTSSVAPVAGQGAWMGIWKSSTVAATGSPDYNPAFPNTRNFVGWLVSGTDGSGSFQLPDTLLSVATDVSSFDPSTGREFVSLYTDSGGDPYMQVEKVPVEIGSSQGAYFAFSVEDESAKVDLAWNEISSTPSSGEHRQASRLAAAPGPDYGALNGSAGNGPFTGAVVNYPLTVEDTGSFVASGTAKLTDVNDLSAAISSVDLDWLRDQRSTMTWGSKGLLTDVKYGGLRRDLSLAFEMDGEAESEDAVIFNQQDGVFVGGSDRLTAGQVASGMPIAARYPYRDFQGSGTTFSNDIVEGPTISSRTGGDSINVTLRGPTWWALRDYANLYKRISGSSGDYSMESRAYFPNIDEGSQFSRKLGIITGRGSIWDLEEDYDRRQTDTARPYIFRPARANYAPVSLGSSTLISLSVRPDGASGINNLAVCVDMFFYLWNPYNRKITCDSLVVAMDEGIPGNIGIWISEVDETTGNVTSTTGYHRNLSTLLNQNLSNTYGNTRGKIPFLIKDENGDSITLEPGEIVIASPSGVTGEANLGFNINSDSGIIMTDLVGNSISPRPGVTFDTGPVPPIKDSDIIEYVYVNEGRLVDHTNAMRHEVQLFLPPNGLTAGQLTSASNFGDELQLLHFPSHGGLGESGFNEYLSPEANGQAPLGEVSAAGLLGAKQFIGASTALMKPAAWQGNNPNPVEVFSQFNPNPMATARDLNRICMPNQVYNLLTDADPGNLLNNYGISYSGSVRNAFWGLSYDDLGSTRFPMIDIPSSPLISLASFANANISVMASEPFQAIGNSWSHPMVPVNSTFGPVHDKGIFQPMTMHDLSWQMNDALFDRYYFSGIAPAFTITGTGYSSSGPSTAPLTAPLQRFYEVSGSDYRTANANPMLIPYIPSGMTAQDVVDDLDEEDGYLKTGAYSLVNGAFNVNSTSVEAWAALLRANRGLEVLFAEGSSDSSGDTPFPGSTIPSEDGNGAKPDWSGFSRLTDPQVTDLANAIVDQVKLRGPFMSLSDFVNRRVGTPVNDGTHYSGALQAAIDVSGINQAVQSSAGGVDPVYKDSTLNYFQVPQQTGGRTTASSIPGEINQAELLLPLAPRLTARSDTFRIRAYGEVRSPVSQEIVSTAVCEVVVQRLPEYLDSKTDADNNEPWDEATDPISPTASALNLLNQQFGRRLKVVQMRWLTPEEI